MLHGLRDAQVAARLLDGERAPVKVVLLHRQAHRPRLAEPGAVCGARQLDGEALVDLGQLVGEDREADSAGALRGGKLDGAAGLCKIRPATDGLARRVNNCPGHGHGAECAGVTRQFERQRADGFCHHTAARE